MNNKYVTSNRACSRHIDFLFNGELITPDEVTYSIYNGGGNIVNSKEDITIDDYSTSVDISIDSTTNQSGSLNDVRYLIVTYTYNNQVIPITDYYMLRDNVNFPLSKDEIRFVLGASQVEIEDDLIDIFSAYQEVQDETGLELATILGDGGASFPFAVKAVKFKAAINCSMALEALLYRSEGADNTKYGRFSNIDFDALRARLVNSYTAAITTLGGTSTDQTYAVVAQGTDPVTNT